MTSTHPGLADGPAYLDYNATTPVDPGVLEAMLPYLSTEFGNPSSTHGYGLRARSALEQAREQVRGLVSGGGRAVFTGSGSEADALAIRGAVLARVAAGHQRPHVITQVTEHPAVLAACQHLEQYHGVRVTYLGVDRFGRVEPESVRESLTPDTVLVSVMQANNETGTIQPVEAIAEVTREHGVLLHCDAAQSVGKLVVDADALGVDLLTIVGHKMYAPKGIAALWIREGVDLTPIVGGGGQEGALRAGTENVAFAVGLGAAADLAADALAVGEAERLRELRDRLHAGLEGRLPGPGPSQRASHRAAAQHAEHRSRRGTRTHAPRARHRHRRVHRLGVPRRPRRAVTGAERDGDSGARGTRRHPVVLGPLDHPG